MDVGTWCLVTDLLELDLSIQSVMDSYLVCGMLFFLRGKSYGTRM
jgi:hypothetical protein